MKELLQIQNAVLDALNQAGLPALQTFPDQNARRYRGPVAAVCVGAATGKTLGFCNYLGEMVNPKTGFSQEIYGKRLEAEIAVDIYGDRASDCNHGCETAAEVLLGGLPAGLKPGELSWEEVRFEEASGLFRRCGRLRCQALFLAAADAGGSAFLDFILKGVLNT